jgi:hypothetical protein
VTLNNIVDMLSVILLFVRNGDAECGKLNKVYSPQGNLRVFFVFYRWA